MPSARTRCNPRSSPTRSNKHFTSLSFHGQIVPCLTTNYNGISRTPVRRTAMRLRSNEYCPVHRSLSCCGREAVPHKPRLIRLGVQRIEDPHHPRGYRELRSPGEMRKLLNRKIVEQDRMCAICHEEFTDYNDIVPDHRDPKGMGGAWRDDHPDNIQATHWWCNGEKGSTRQMTDG
jgi:hypothetical protein